MSVRDVEAAANWYIDVLGFERRYEGMWDGIPVFVGKAPLRSRYFRFDQKKKRQRPRTAAFKYFI